MNNQNYYDILNVLPTATVEEIKQMYRQQVREHHPDLHPGDRAAEERIKLINSAWAVLSDGEQRGAYDRSLGRYATSGSIPPAASSGHYGGYDVTYKVAITSREAVAGCIGSLQFHAADGRPYTVAIRIPPGATNGLKVRVTGAGGPGLHGGRRGDLIAVITVEKERTTNKEQ